MRLAVRNVLSSAGVALCLAAIGRAQTPCNTWQTLPPAPVSPNPIAGLVWNAATQDLFQATDEGDGGHSGTQPWVGRRVGNAWVTILDPNAFNSGSVLGLDLLDLGSGPTLYVRGSWSSLTGQTNLLRWNGTSFVNEPNVPVVPHGLAVFDDGSGPALYACSHLNVYRLTGGTWVSIGLATIGSFGLQTILVHDDGSGPALYVAGKFTSIGGVAAADIARWNGVSWSALGSGISGQPTTTLNSLRLTKLLSVREEAGPRLYAAGSFLSMDGQPANSIARFDGTGWTGVATNLGQTIYEVSALTWFDDGTGRGAELFATGNIAVLPSTPTFLKRLGGGVWSDVLPAGSGLAPTWDGALLVADLPETNGVDLLASIYGGQSVGRTTGRFEACGQTGRITCVGDGSSGACPCGNNSPTAAQAGCVHSLGTGGALRAGGIASLTQETLHLDGSSMNDGPVIYYQGTQPNLIPFGDGFICATGSIIRLRLLFNSGGASNDPEPGGPALSVQGFITSPGTRYYSARYRDGDLSYCTSGTFNYTNGVAIVWSP